MALPAQLVSLELVCKYKRISISRKSRQKIVPPKKMDIVEIVYSSVIVDIVYSSVIVDIVYSSLTDVSQCISDLNKKCSFLHLHNYN